MISEESSKKHHALITDGPMAYHERYYAMPLDGMGLLALVSAHQNEKEGRD